MLHILLVDDERNERTGIRFLIRKYGLPLQVAEAVNGKEALAYIKAHTVDILLTDIKMPYMDGLELAKAVFEYNPAIKIIIFSAYGEFQYAKKALEANAVNYLLKPIEVDEFVSVMQNVIAECVTQQRIAIKEQARIEKDQKQALYQLLTGARFQTDEAGRREAPDDGVRLTGKYLTLINIETRNSIFLTKEAEFLRLVQAYAPAPFTYVNLYPNAAYLLLESDERLTEAALMDFAAKLRRDMHQVLDAYHSILIGESFEGSESLKEQAALLNNLRAGIFEGDEGILFAEKMMAHNHYYAEDVEACRKIIVEAIARKDMDEVALRIQRLVVSLHNEKALSVIYLHHIFYDLLTRLYHAQGIDDSALIQKRIEQVASCNGKEALSSLFQDIMAEVTQNAEPFGEKSLSGKVRHIIERDYGKDLSLESIAAQVHLSPAYLSYLYKQETGTNIIKELADFRMAKAKELLADTSLRISDVAQKCGYANPSYFNRLFKNMHGITPTQYREKA